MWVKNKPPNKVWQAWVFVGDSGWQLSCLSGDLVNQSLLRKKTQALCGSDASATACMVNRLSRFAFGKKKFGWEITVETRFLFLSISDQLLFYWLVFINRWICSIRRASSMSVPSGFWTCEIGIRRGGFRRTKVSSCMYPPTWITWLWSTEACLSWEASQLRCCCKQLRHANLSASQLEHTGNGVLPGEQHSQKACVQVPHIWHGWHKELSASGLRVLIAYIALAPSSQMRRERGIDSTSQSGLSLTHLFAKVWSFFKSSFTSGDEWWEVMISSQPLSEKHWIHKGWYHRLSKSLGVWA